MTRILNRDYASKLHITAESTDPMDLTYADTSDKTVSIVSIYGYGVVIMPKLPVCDKYRVPMNRVHAQNFIKKYIGLDISINSDNFEPILIKTASQDIGAALAGSWYHNFKQTSKYISPIPKESFFQIVEMALNKAGLSLDKTPRK